MPRLRTAVLTKIFIVNLGIPLVLGTIREQIVGLWNPRLDMTLYERFVFSFRPMTTGAIVVLAIVAFVWIARMLRPLFRYIESGTDYQAARRAAIRIPWILLLLHVGGWVVGTFVLYAFVFNWDSPGGIRFFWSLQISMSTGFVTGIFGALAINALLLDAKKQLGMTDIREDESDLFVRIKDYLILFATVYLQTVHLVHVAMLYTAGVELPANYPSFGLSAFVVTLYGAVSYFAMLWLSKKEEKYQRSVLQSRVRELSRAEGDLTQRIILINFDEIGDMAHHFNAFLAGLARIVRQIRTFTEGLAKTGEELSAEMEQTQRAVEQNSENVENIRRQIITQASSVTESTASVEQISQNVASLESLITDQASSVTESSAAVEQMVANIGSITANLENVVANFASLIEASDVGKQKLNFVSAQIREVAEQSASLAQANKLISGIAAQTNLLAMNAAIEAAHAGDAGRGFAVVADEIRNLAENSANQSKNINRELKATREVIGKVVEATGEAESAFDNVRALIDKTNELERQVMESMEEQRAGSTEVLKALSLINDITGKVKTASSEMNDGSSAVKGEMQTLLTMTEDIRTNIDAVAGRTAEIADAVTNVSELSRQNAENISGVLRESGRFRVDHDGGF